MNLWARLLLSLAVLCAWTVEAIPLSRGDVLVSGFACCQVPLSDPSAYQRLLSFTRYGEPLRFDERRGGGDVLQFSDGSLYAIQSTSVGYGVELLSPDLVTVTSWPVKDRPIALAGSRGGELLVLNEGGTYSWYSREGALRGGGSLPVTRGEIVSSGDLGNDQCTLYYTASKLLGSTALSRYDVCRGAALAPFPDLLPDWAQTIRVAGDGTVFVAAGPSIYHYVGDRADIITVPPGDECWGLALDADGGYWCAGEFLRHIDGGRVVSTPARLSAISSFSSHVVVVGVPRASTIVSTVPVLTEWSLLMLMGLLLVCAWLRLR